MMEFLGPVPYNNNYFQFMGLAHLIIIIFILLLIILTYIFRKAIVNYKKVIRIILGVLLISMHLANKVWLFANNLHTMDNILPLHLSSISTIILGLVLIFDNKKIFIIIYFWALAAGIQATFVPAIEHGYNHFRFYQFFLDHGLLFYSPFYMMIIYDYRPRYKEMWLSYLYLIIYGLIVMGVDFALEVNYMILREKPTINTPLDYMGDWPFYVFFLIIAELGVFHLLYLLSKIKNQKLSNFLLNYFYINLPLFFNLLYKLRYRLK